MTKGRAIVATFGDMEGDIAGWGHVLLCCVCRPTFLAKMEGNMLIANIDCTQKIYSFIKSISIVPVFLERFNSKPGMRESTWYQFLPFLVLYYQKVEIFLWRWTRYIRFEYSGIAIIHTGKERIEIGWKLASEEILHNFCQKNRIQTLFNQFSKIHRMLGHCIIGVFF